MTDAAASARSCVMSNAAWRRHATHLRAHAELPRLTEEQRARLLREAAADRQADMWLTGAIEAA